jgi:hypothetical protein
MYYTKLSEFSDSSDAYFEHYHNHWFLGRVIYTSDLISALSELRLAYKKYPERRMRIKDMAHVLSSGVNSFKSKDKNKFVASTKPDFKEQVIQSLF